MDLIFSPFDLSGKYCSYCEQPLTKGYYKINSKYLKKKHFPDRDSNMFCSKDCLFDALGVVFVSGICKPENM